MNRAKYIITSNHLNEVRHEIVDGIKDLLLKVKNGHLEISSNRVPNPIVDFPSGKCMVQMAYLTHKGTGDLVIKCQPISDHLGRVLFITENTGFKCHTSLLYRSIITKFRSSSRKGT